jgi:hypothetical protein
MNDGFRFRFLVQPYVARVGDHPVAVAIILDKWCDNLRAPTPYVELMCAKLVAHWYITRLWWLNSSRAVWGTMMASTTV